MLTSSVGLTPFSEMLLSSNPQCCPYATTGAVSHPISSSSSPHPSDPLHSTQPLEILIKAGSVRLERELTFIDQDLMRDCHTPATVYKLCYIS